MSSVSRNSGKEQLILSTDVARERAENFDGKDPFPWIRPALLSADDIKQYAKKTGMIAPLYDGDRMKKASYQGKIGESAYEYNDSEELVRVTIDDKLVVKANSIVFVECDIDFRLPNFIAVRFNLHIRHVHRGLLLGTGPLVDPGYCGKLCIPLHNLTDKDYPIPRNEGLIWMEFTKTSRNPGEGRDPSSKEYWDICKFIKRAASQYNQVPVSIRSSIVALQEYREIAERAETSSKNSAASVKKITTIGYLAGGAVLLSVFISVVSFVVAAYFDIRSVYDSVIPQAESNDKSIRDLKSKVEGVEEEIRSLRDQIIDGRNQDNSP